jgi:hypothetical protein
VRSVGHGERVASSLRGNRPLNPEPASEASLLPLSDVNAEPTAEPVASWRPGQLLWPHGRTKLVILAGLGSRTGDAEREFYGLAQYVARHGNYDPKRDVLEASYSGHAVGDVWGPRPYAASDTRRPLVESVEAIAGSLDWYRASLPAETRLCLICYSLGGVVGLDGAALAVARDRAAWHGRLAGLVTLASPLLGTSAGTFVEWAWLVATDPDPLGAVGSALALRWRDPEERERVGRRAAFLRAMGASVLTLADPGDAVVRPEEALLPAPDQVAADLLVPTQRVRPGTHGHGAILDEPSVWQRILALVGPQQPLSAVGPNGRVDPIEDELQAIKAKLRAEGRLR